jgi:transcriptional regulator with XRE-family HTH domain
MDDDDSTIGTRLRELRRWRRMTLAEVAGLAGISTSYLSMAERGLRSLDRRSLISALAAALRVSETELTGGPHLGSDPLQSGPHAAIPALREALQTNKLTSAAVDRARPLAEIACEVTSQIVPMGANADYVGTGSQLPGVLDELYWHAAQDGDEASRRLALETLVEACVVAGLTAKDLGYLDLAHVAALRAEAAADLLDDPVQRGKAECLRIWAFPRERSWDRRLVAAESAAGDLEPHVRSPLGLHVLGMLTLHAALGAAVVQRPDVVSHWLAEAAQIARRVPDDVTGNWQSFSQTNVRLWSLAIAVERGEGGRAVLEVASGTDSAKLTNATRRAAMHLDVGRGLARDPATREEAVTWLRRAENAAPQWIRNYVPAREAVAFLLTRARATAGGRELRGMAARMGVPH